MTINLDDKGFKTVAKEYDLFFIDIWGVLHNGISIFNNSLKVLNELENLKKEYVLLTNAPRPNFVVRRFLENMGLDKKISNKDLKNLVKESQTPRGLNEQGVKELRKAGFYRSTEKTLNSILKRLNKV